MATAPFPPGKKAGEFKCGPGLPLQGFRRRLDRREAFTAFVSTLMGFA
jgi:hypothetical protein